MSLLGSKADLTRSVLSIAISSTLAFAQQPTEGRKAPTGNVDGIVSDTSLAPVAAATVSILGSGVRVVTGGNGRFRMADLPPGQYILLVQHIGFEPAATHVQVMEADTVRLSIALTRMANLLDTVKVTGTQATWRKQEFNERRAHSLGQFMTAEEIDKRNTARATELLRTFRSIDVVAPPKSSASSPTFLAVSHRSAGKRLGPCYTTVFLDGHPMPTPFNLDDLPSPKELMGIEVYSGPGTVPPQYARLDSGCGVILVWTKDGS